MKMKTRSLTLIIIVLLTVASAMPLVVSAKEKPEQYMILEHRENPQTVTTAYASTDDSMTNPDYALIGISWGGVAQYWINPKNNYKLSTTSVVTTITTSAYTWDTETSANVFSYQGTTTRTSGRRDGYNVIDWGIYQNGVIAVTMIWYSGSQILEIDMRMNTRYKWSLNGEARKMDVQNIVTHEFGHWAGLNDLYDTQDYWLTMYGYSGYGVTYQRTLGLGDIYGLQAVYGT